MVDIVKAEIDGGMCDIMSAPNDVKCAVFDDDEESIEYLDELVRDNDVVIHMHDCYVWDVYIKKEIIVEITDNDCDDDLPEILTYEGPN